ncbi:hypothetical protein [Natrinema sp. DC36]|uniref:hypothetical protein n=1 Tax=Natrinema sp. DC36 TaxID=2878680 RepID=UPI0031F316CF
METLHDAITKCLESGHRRLPVYAETLDNIVGTADIHELARAQQRDTPGETFVGDLKLLDPPQYVPESKSVDELLGDADVANANGGDHRRVRDDGGTRDGRRPHRGDCG